MRRPKRAKRSPKGTFTPLPPQPDWERVAIGLIFQNCLQVGLLANQVEFIAQLEKAALGASFRTAAVTSQILRDGEVRIEAYLLGYPLVIATSLAERARLELLIQFSRNEVTEALVHIFIELCDRAFQAQGGVIRVSGELNWSRS